jgi:hypothetical protein
MQIENDRIDNRSTELQRRVTDYRCMSLSNECSVLGKDAMKMGGTVIIKWSFSPANSKLHTTLLPAYRLHRFVLEYSSFRIIKLSVNIQNM